MTTTASLRRALVALAIAAAAAGCVFLGLVLASDHVDDRATTAVLGLLVGWSFTGTGLLAWWRRPDNRTGALMTAVGFAWFASGMGEADDDLLFTAGIALDALFPVIAGHLVLAFPTGRLETRAERILIGAGYLSATLLQIPSLLFEEHAGRAPRNLLVLHPDQDLSDVLDGVQFAVVLPVIAASIVLLVRRWRSASGPQRRVLAPVLWTGGAAFVVYAVAAALDTAGTTVDALERVAVLLLATVPFGFLAGLLRSRLTQADRIAELVGRLGQAPGPDTVRAALAEALGDPSVALAYWLPESERFVDAAGRPVDLPAGEWTEVESHGRRIAAIRHDRSLADQPQLVRAAGAAAALALENQRLAAELRARIEDLRASRARLVSAGDAERRRLERNLHDGAQARMVGLAAKLGMARSKVDGDGELATLLEESRVELMASLEELRAVARGLHPAVLTDRGLDAAVRGLAFRAPLPVEIAGAAPDDLPPPVATALYYVVAEALTNVAKYAAASGATVAVRREGADVVAEVADDGVGGADEDGGSGLRGLSDRVAALDGRLELSSPPGGGTVVRVRIPT
ncbi:MAG TPA: ATP-binding protein [Solirubrobacteraceae bacterium]|nr:ATP-binding protein [Solirubrobacteraceae bacterium]